MISSLDDFAGPISLDASVAINLASSGYAKAILQALPNQFCITRVVFQELERGKENGWGHADIIEECSRENLFKVVELDEPASRIFESLVIGHTQDALDDGEAATIAYSVVENAITLTDDRKAVRIAGERFPNLRQGVSIDLFSHRRVSQALSREQHIEAVHNALCKSKMHVFPDHMAWVTSLLGPERLISCHSLPAAIRGLPGR